MSAAALRVEAWAKLNLYLHVVGRRPDGYHLLDSLITFVAVGDSIEVRPADGLHLTIDGPFAHGLSAGADNLVLRAASELALAAGIVPRAAIRLTKRLPVASGIGGGSADAAATLKALDRLWRLALGDDARAALALRLGADVPMCLAGRTAFVGGIGEQLAKAPVLPACWFVLANPGVALPTPSVFRARSGPFATAARFGAPASDARALAALLAERRNDLTAAAIGLAPEIACVLAALAALPGALLARMSGSGATCFALFATQDLARSGAARLGACEPAWWVAAAPVVEAAAADTWAEDARAADACVAEGEASG